MLCCLQAFVESKDGTKIPMFIVHRAGIQMDGSNPTLLYGYGGELLSVYSTLLASQNVTCHSAVAMYAARRGCMHGVHGEVGCKGRHDY